MASEGPRFDPLQTHHSSSLINRRCVKMCGSVAKWIMRPTSTLFFLQNEKRSFVFFSKNSRYNFEQTKTSSSSSFS